ncbi:MAG: penicillin V acylase-like amidase (Ntn superfamily) [Patiriisocius sp.]|jgi:penicillin V acylase-like amidase (Ntn superfamily)
MKTKNIISAFLLSLFVICFQHAAYACSMYKVTVDGTTMVGCNEDAWRTTSNIWFSNSKNKNEYGACFTGSRKVGSNKFAPQSGMNEEGLVFSRLVAYHPDKNLNQSDKKQTSNDVQYLTDILHKCKTVDEVQKYVEMYDRQNFLEDVFIYIDKSGDYLVVEPYQTISGNDPSYVLANFCPSLTSNLEARKQTKYKNGEDYLKVHELDTSLDFCRSMSDSMHVCRKRNGDGTLLTSIWDTQKGRVNLYFYHSYDSTIQYDLMEELALGDHTISLPGLFPPNPEFNRLSDYKTPFNVNALRVTLVLIAGCIFFLAFIFLISYFKKNISDRFNFIKLLFIGLNILLIAYLFVLATNINIYYFDAPYQHFSSDLISLSSYIPLILLLLIAPITFYTIRYIKVNNKSIWMKSALIFNNITYLILMLGFGYWGLFDIFS